MHSAAITFTDWPEHGEMIGGYFDEHPWGTFDAPIIVEDPEFPGMQQWPHSFELKHSGAAYCSAPVPARKSRAGRRRYSKTSVTLFCNAQ